MAKAGSKYAVVPAEYDDNVFINCPFTSDYAELFQALVFTVVDCGFIPRASLEKSNSGETRISKLYRIIGECRYGIHDISTTELDPANNLPRFNMPLELGIFLGATEYGPPPQVSKACLILDRERYRYQKFCSDLGGQDPKPHDGNAGHAVRAVRNWLRAERPAVRLPSGKRIAERLEKFESDLPLVADSLGLEADALEFLDLRAAIAEWLLTNPRAA